MADSSPASLQIARRIQQLSEITGKAVSWLTLLMMLLMTLVVVLRYGFGMGWIALQESVLYLHAMVLMLGMAYTMKHDGHVRVDIFFRRFPPKKKNWVNLGGHLLFLIPTCCFILYMSWPYVAQSWSILEGSQEAGGLPLVFVLKGLLLLTPVLLILQAMAEFIQVLILGSTESQQNDLEAL